MKLAGLFAAAFLTLRLSAQTPPPYTPIVFDEDWGYLRDRSKSLDWSDDLKHLNLSASGDAYVSIGGQLRERGEYLDYAGWGAQNPHSGYLLQRYLLNTDWVLSNSVRIFVQAGSSFENGRDGGPRPSIDQSKAYMNQAFLDWKPIAALNVRAGRQLVSLGSTRLFAIGAGLNIEQPFDGVRLTLHTGPWTFEGLALRPVLTQDGIFKTKPNADVETWGLYGTRALHVTNVDFYYIGFDHKLARWDSGAGREQRETAGIRVYKRTPVWHYDFEYTNQFGRFGASDIRAWAAGYSASYRFQNALVTPKIELDGGITSGNHNAPGKTLGTFNALFPNGSYLSQSQLIGPYNVYIVRPKLEFHLTPKLSFNPNFEALWRESTTDGIYNIAGFPTHPGRPSKARFVGSQIQVEVDYNFTRHLSGALAYEHFFPGEYLKQTPPNRNVNFFSPQITYTF